MLGDFVILGANQGDRRCVGRRSGLGSMSVERYSEWSRQRYWLVAVEPRVSLNPAAAPREALSGWSL